MKSNAKYMLILYVGVQLRTLHELTHGGIEDLKVNLFANFARIINKISKMKQLILGLIVLISIGSCQLSKEDQQRMAISEKIESELATGMRNDEIFLGFNFGMSRTDVTRHLEKMKNDNKLYINRLNEYEYEFDFGERLPRKARANFNFEYNEGKLYQLALFVKSDEMISTPRIIQLRLAMIYSEKYGSNLVEKSILDEENYIWIHGNRMIKIIAGIDDARVFYTDMVAEKGKKIQDTKKAEKAKEKLKSDI